MSSELELRFGHGAFEHKTHVKGTEKWGNAELARRKRPATEPHSTRICTMIEDVAKVRLLPLTHRAHEVAYKHGALVEE